MAVKTFTTGEVLTASDTNTYLNNGGLVYISGTTVGTGVSSVTVSRAFSSTYDNYRVIINNVDASADAVALRFSLGSTNTGYYGSFLYDLYTGGDNAYSRANNGAYQIICWTGPSDDTFLAFDVFGPNLAKPTAYAGMIWGGSYAGWFAGKQTATTQYTAFTLTPSSGTLTGGSIRVYGYRQAEMTRPNIQIDDEVREMTEEEYADLIASGWTPGEEAEPE